MGEIPTWGKNVPWGQHLGTRNFIQSDCSRTYDFDTPHKHTQPFHRTE